MVAFTCALTSVLEINVVAASGTVLIKTCHPETKPDPTILIYPPVTSTAVTEVLL